VTDWNRGLWVILVVICLFGLAAGCARQQNGAVDPKAFSLWVVPF
jgi:hypothetical protein